MSTVTLMRDSVSVSRRVRDVRAGWSPRERCQRAHQGRCQLQEFLTLIAESDAEPEIWAVGALTDTDLQRLALQC